MALQIDGIILDTLTSDPSSPSEGQIWYDSVNYLYKIYRNGTVTSFTDAIAFAAHATSTSNPHSVTLEQARTAGSTLAGSINMGGNAITNLGAGTNPTDAAQRQWVTDQVNQKVAGLDWQESVLSQLTTPPGSPSTGDRYLIIATATGVWAGKETQIAEYNGAAWAYYVPTEGATVRVEADNLVYTFDGVSWGNIGAAVDHGALVGLGDDDHLQYLPRSGVRAMTGGLDMGTNNISNAGTINGVTITAHATRHNPGGADALSVGVPVAITDSTNAQGTGSSYALNDHQHAHGDRGGGSLHSLVSVSQHGFAPQSNFTGSANPTSNDDNTAGYRVGSVWINQTTNRVWQAINVATGAAVWAELTNIAGVLPTKAGKVLNASFSGSPKKATVTFITPFANTNYSINVTALVGSGGATYAPVVESQLAGSFVINVGANNIGNLTAVSWTAINNGEA